MSEHTAGPWHVDPKAPEESYFEDVNILREDGLAVAVAVHNGNIDPATVKANAHLIAAAPDLLEALKEALDLLRKEAPGTPLNNHRFDAIGIRAYAAIAKAEGRS